MNTLSYKTISANKETAKKEWVVIDATDQVVGVSALRSVSYTHLTLPTKA